MKRLCFLLLFAGMFASCSRAGDVWFEENDTDKGAAAGFARSTQAPTDPHRLEAIQQALDEVADASGLERIELQPVNRFRESSTRRP